MSMGDTSFISELRINGQPLSIGVKIDGYLLATKGVIYPYPTFPIIQAADGTYWAVGINVVDGEGVLTTTQVFL